MINTLSEHVSSPLHWSNMNWGISGLIYVRAEAGYDLLERYVQIFLFEHTARARVESFYLRHTDGADTLIKLANICKIPILCYLW